MSLFNDFLQEHSRLFNQLSVLEPQLIHTAKSAADVLRSGGRLFFCGNGGSAADAQHIAIGNDFGYDYVFSRQLEGVSSPGDMLFLITTSGHSKNLLIAAETAKKLGVVTVGLLGKGGGKLASIVDDSIIVPTSDTARTQEAHIFIGHTLCALIEAELGYGKWST